MLHNYYGSLCTMMYEILHKQAPRDELDFYLSYADKNHRILEPLCGSGRFFVPFAEKGFNICGVDSSGEMLRELQRKLPGAQVEQNDILNFSAEEKFDYIFITSGSVSLFTDIEQCKSVLRVIKGLLAAEGKFVFAVDTVADRCADDAEYRTAVSVKTAEGFDLILKNKNRYDDRTQTQFSPGVYELYDGGKLLQSEEMDFRTHLYKFGEMESYLREIGFSSVKAYSSFSKEIAVNDKCEMLLYECGL
ncbi:MAG: class I SAM-dependent methyltransferase [Christensenellales bacterium]